MKLSASKNLDALQADGLLRLDRAMRAKRNALDPRAALNADVRAAKLADALANPAAEEAKMILAKAAESSARFADLEADRQRRQALIRAATKPADIETALGDLA